MAQNAESLTGKMLIAMPSLDDPRFSTSVVYICDHTDDGAMGLIVNKPNPDLDMPTLLAQLEIDASADLSARTIYFGGPVELGRGFVLHSSDYVSSVTTLEVNETVHMTATLDILEDIGRGTGPSRWLMALGYAGWGPGQLENELAENAWLVCDGAPDLMFDGADDGKWEAALQTIGVSSAILSPAGGRA